jgi:rhomboid family GlyGly-CTERM serine protease
VRGVLAWLALAGVLLGGALLLQGAPSAAWDWQPALARSQPWRAWTAAWVHWSPSHLTMNAAGLAAMGLLGWRATVKPRDALAWAAAWPLTHLGLLAQPSLLHYGGLSGVLHAGAAIVAWRLLRNGRGRQRAVGALLAGGLLLKLLSETPWRAATLAVPGWDFAVAPLAHSTGALAGLVCILALDGLACRRVRPVEPTSS